MSGGLSGKRVVITGSSQGIGRAIALRCAREGARVVLNASGQGQGGPEAAEALLGALVREIEAEGGEALYSVGSVAEVAAADRLIETAVEGFGGLDGLVNVAGIAGPSASSIREISVEDWRRVVAIHLDGTFFCCRAAVPHLIAAGGGAIVNTSSHGHLGGYGGTAYGAAKGGINSLSYALAADLASDGIRVNAVCPGAKTRLSSGPEYEALITDLEARGLLSPALAKNSLNAPAPEGCAALYAYLLSDAARGITGELFSASGPYVGVFDRSDERMLGFRQPAEDAKADDPNVWTLAELAALLPKRLAVSSDADADTDADTGSSPRSSTPGRGARA